ncbi:Uncharacterized protein FWK35_00015814 [Aphis craccivora]|uniref:Secreted protein n=1 Tax=Aphis craccivora TaxID=307492 RepID=A0A6G0Z4A1_APHCR|nr:Uncharacterized protein FWK35_00015814 [Aphis craccivora]
MMCVFFFCVSVYSITSRNNAPISNYGGGFRCKSEYLWLYRSKVNIFQQFSKKSRKTKKKKMTDEREILRNTSFRPNRFFYMVVIQKLITIILEIFTKCLCQCYLYTVKFSKIFDFF